MAKRVYFAFHYKDVIDFRANVVRNHNALVTSQKAGYFDASIWEEAQKKGDIALKRMINSELDNTSVTAVLIGSETYRRTWVRYEIFKSIDVGNLLLGIHINGIPCKNKKTKDLGPDPFKHCALRISADGTKGTPMVWNIDKWATFSKFGEFEIGIQSAARRGKILPLTTWFSTYKWNADNGFANFSKWIGS
ncbi:MAG: TIR domain-containing protein [Luteolibacter sp.]